MSHISSSRELPDKVVIKYLPDEVLAEAFTESIIDPEFSLTKYVEQNGIRFDEFTYEPVH